MFTPVVRFLLMIILGGLAVFFAYHNDIALLLAASFLSLFLLWDYLKRGTVPLSLRKLRKNEYSAAEKILNFTTYPNRLLKNEKIYYKFIKGFVEREKDNFEQAEKYLLEVKNSPLKNENDRAMVLLALADIELIKGNKPQAKEWVLQMKNLKVSPALMPSVRKMQEWLQL